MTYMPIFVLVVFGILGDVEGIPLQTDQRLASPTDNNSTIIKKKKKPIDVTRFSHRLII